MRNSITAILLAVLAGNAVAGWTLINTTTKATYYVDKDTIWRSGSTVKMWSLTNYSAPQELVKGESLLSSSSLTEYDCAERKSRSLQSFPYKGQMGGGGILFMSKNMGDWMYPPPGTVASLELKIACATK